MPQGQKTGTDRYTRTIASIHLYARHLYSNSCLFIIWCTKRKKMSTARFPLCDTRLESSQKLLCSAAHDAPNPLVHVRQKKQMFSERINPQSATNVAVPQRRAFLLSPSENYSQTSAVRASPGSSVPPFHSGLQNYRSITTLAVDVDNKDSM